MAKLDLKRTVKAGLQGGLWVGLGYLGTTKGAGYLASTFPPVKEFMSKGVWHKAGVEAATGLLLAGGAAALMSKKSSTAARKAGAYMAAGAILGAFGEMAYSKVDELTAGMGAPGGNARAHLARRLAPAGVAPQNSMLRAGGGIVMGASAEDADQAVFGLGRPGGRYISPQYQWAGIREI